MSATDDEQQCDEDDERAARERRERREERRRRKERTRREGLRRRLGDSSAFKRETFYALENLNRANWPAKIVGGALFALILLNAVVVFVSAQPGLDPVAANIIQGFYRFSTVCFFVEYIARIWIADLAYGNCTPARARLRYIFSPWGIIDLLSFGPNMAAWFLPVTPALQNVISVVRLVRLIKISRYMRGLRTIGRVISKHYHEIVASFLVIAMLVVVASVVMYEIEHPAQPDKFNNLLSGIYWPRPLSQAPAMAIWCPSRRPAALWARSSCSCRWRSWPFPAASSRPASWPSSKTPTSARSSATSAARTLVKTTATRRSAPPTKKPSMTRLLPHNVPTNDGFSG